MDFFLLQPSFDGAPWHGGGPTGFSGAVEALKALSQSVQSQFEIEGLGTVFRCRDGQSRRRMFQPDSRLRLVFPLASRPPRSISLDDDLTSQNLKIGAEHS